MATYTGRLTDAVPAALLSVAPQLEFVLSAPSTVLSNDFLLTTKPVQAVFSSTVVFSVELTPNDQIAGSTHYDAYAKWLDPAGNFISLNLFSFYAEAGGGSIALMSMTPAGWNPAQIIFQPDQPDPWPVGWVWINSTTGVVKKRVS